MHVAEMCASPCNNSVYSKYLAAKLNEWLPDVSLPAAERVTTFNTRKPGCNVHTT